MGNQLWAGEDALPYSRVPIRGGRRKLPQNWQIIEQQADQTRHPAPDRRPRPEQHRPEHGGRTPGYRCTAQNLYPTAA